MAKNIDVEESMPRLVSRQRHRHNISAQTCVDYYRLNFSIPFLDILLNELNTRFDSTSAQNVVEFMHLLPSSIASKKPATLQPCDLLDFYGNDLISVVSFDAELDLWQQKWLTELDLATTLNTPSKALQHTDSDFFPNIEVLLKIMATLPVTTCECERSISMLKLIKSPLRSSMGEERLNWLAMLYHHQNVQLTPEEVVDEFANRHPRRMILN